MNNQNTNTAENIFLSFSDKFPERFKAMGHLVGTYVFTTSLGLVRVEILHSHAEDCYDAMVYSLDTESDSWKGWHNHAWRSQSTFQEILTEVLNCFTPEEIPDDEKLAGFRIEIGDGTNIDHRELAEKLGNKFKLYNLLFEKTKHGNAFNFDALKGTPITLDLIDKLIPPPPGVVARAVTIAILG